MTNLEATNNLNNLNKLKENHTDALPAKVAFRIAKNIDILKTELGVYNSQRNEIVEKYSDEDDKTRVSRDNPNYAKALEELTELDSEPCEVALKTVTLDELEGLEFTIEEIELMNCMIEE